MAETILRWDPFEESSVTHKYFMRIIVCNYVLHRSEILDIHYVESKKIIKIMKKLSILWKIDIINKKYFI